MHCTFSQVKNSLIAILMKSLCYQSQTGMGAAPMWLSHTRGHQEICSWLVKVSSFQGAKKETLAGTVFMPVSE